MNGLRQPPDVMQQELASLVHLLGGMAPKHLVAVGGLVPPLLVPEAPNPHRGSADIDLSLSMAITRGETSDYYRSLEAAIEPYFEPFTAGFRWRKRDGVAGVRLLVDFMGPDAEATYLETGRCSWKTRWRRATPAWSCGRTRSLRPPSSTRTRVQPRSSVFRSSMKKAYTPMSRSGIPALSASSPPRLMRSPRGPTPKTATTFRGCACAAESPEEVAAWVADCPAFKNGYFPESVDKLQKAFKEATYPGPSGYASEMNPNLVPDDEGYDRDRNAAYLRVSSVLEILKDRLWDEPA